MQNTVMQPSKEKIAEFCERHHIRRLSFFGSGSAAACCRLVRASLLAARVERGSRSRGPTSRKQASGEQNGSNLPHSTMRDWPHSPVHRFAEPGAYMVTAGTYLKEPFFRGTGRLEHLCSSLLELAEKYGWNLQAWAVFPNHYHFVALSPAQPASLGDFTKHLHSVTAIQANRWDRVEGRKVWYQYWDSQLTFQKSYLARLSYVHKNAVHHRLAREPSLYPWCSAGWFQRRSTTAFYKTVMDMKVDRVNVPDDFDLNGGDV